MSKKSRMKREKRQASFIGKKGSGLGEAMEKLGFLTFICKAENPQELEYTNYFESEECKKGIVLFSVNSKCIRMLQPDTLFRVGDVATGYENRLKELETDEAIKAFQECREVIVSRADDNRYEVMFEDDSNNPFIIITSPQHWLTQIARFENGREDIRFLIYGRGLKIIADKPCRFRITSSLPCMKAWSSIN